MNSSTRLAMLLGLQLAVGSAFIACGGEDDPEPTPSGGGGNDAGTGNETGSNSGTLQLTYSPMYSAYVEGHEAIVPVMLKDTSLRGKGAKFTSSNEEIAVVTDTAEGANVTVKKDGTVTIKASLDGDTGQAKLTITKFTEAQWTTGRDRYSKSDLAIQPPDGGTISALSLANPAARNANGACNTCHTAQAKTLKIENTPTQIAGYSDNELITIFTMGMKPEGVAQKTMVPAYAWGMFHAWTVTDDEKQGLIAYLRTQTPKANPAMVDYGVKLCPDSGMPTSQADVRLCDNNGNPVSIPGVGGGGGTPDAGTGAGTGGDAGAAPADAGASTDDAG